MKAYRLTPLEQLRLEKKQLKEECKIVEKRMAFQVRYLSDNWRSMLRHSATSSIKNKISDAIGSLTSKRSSRMLPYVSKPKKTNGIVGLLSSNYKTIASSGWGMIKPILWTFLTKKVTSMLFGRKKRKKRKRK